MNTVTSTQAVPFWVFVGVITMSIKGVVMIRIKIMISTYLVISMC